MTTPTESKTVKAYDEDKADQVLRSMLSMLQIGLSTGRDTLAQTGLDGLLQLADRMELQDVTLDKLPPASYHRDGCRLTGKWTGAGHVCNGLPT